MGLDMKQILVELDLGSSADSQLEPIVHAWETGGFKSLLVHVFCGLADETAAIDAARVVVAD